MAGSTVFVYKCTCKLLDADMHYLNVRLKLSFGLINFAITKIQYHFYFLLSFITKSDENTGK